MLIYNGKIFDWHKPDDYAEILKIAALTHDGAWVKTRDNQGHRITSSDGRHTIVITNSAEAFDFIRLTGWAVDTWHLDVTVENATVEITRERR